MNQDDWAKLLADGWVGTIGIDLDELVNWPPIMCPKCWAMKFYWSEMMAQCFYCGWVISRRVQT